MFMLSNTKSESILDNNHVPSSYHEQEAARAEAFLQAVPGQWSTDDHRHIPQCDWPQREILLPDQGWSGVQKVRSQWALCQVLHGVNACVRCSHEEHQKGLRKGLRKACGKARGQGLEQVNKPLC